MDESNLNRVHKLVCASLQMADVPIDKDLFQAGYLDSLAIVTLLVSLEDSFSILFSPETIELDEFKSVESICMYITPMIAQSVP